MVGDTISLFTHLNNNDLVQLLSVLDMLIMVSNEVKSKKKNNNKKTFSFSPIAYWVSKFSTAHACKRIS